MLETFRTQGSYSGHPLFKKKTKEKQHLLFTLHFFNLEKNQTQQKESIWRPMTSVHSTILLDSWTQIEIVT